MNAKFWAINITAFLIIISYTANFFYMVAHGYHSNPFWEATPFQLVFMAAFFYLVTEGKLVQKVILAKRIKDEDTAEEFKVITKISDKTDKMLLDELRLRK